MPLTKRFTKSGKRKQVGDELKGWQAIVNNARGTPSEAQVDAVVTQWALAPNGQNAVLPHQKIPLAIDTNHPNYAQWRDAHKSATSRARSDRQRSQRAQKKVGNHPHGLPCRVRHTWNNPRDTLRMAMLHVQTLEDYGGGTQLNLATDLNATKATTEQLVTHLDKAIGAIEKELRNVSRHPEEHDLRASGHPPVQVFLSSEWYFRIPGRPYTQVERDAIETSLMELSRKYPEWLIVPGTIFWSPDNQTQTKIRIYNEALALLSGAVLKRRIKREQHDIDGDFHVRAKQRWGPDHPVAGNPVMPGPATIPAGASAVGAFSVRGYDFCVEICRDQRVGDATKGYRNNLANTTGADVALFTSNGTSKTDGFVPARNNGYFAWCDGKMNGGAEFYTVTRPATLDQNPSAPNPDPFTLYRNAFEPERDRDAIALEAMGEKTRIEELNDPHYTAFMARFTQVFEAPASADATLKGTVDAAIAGGARPNDPTVKKWYENGMRIQQLLAGGNLPSGHAITAQEQLSMTPYGQALVTIGTEQIAIDATMDATGALRTQAANAFGVTLANVGAGTVNVPKVPRLVVHELVDL